MNKVIRMANGDFKAVLSNGAEFDCEVILENSTGRHYVELPKEAIKICGRQFFVLTKFDKTDVVEFEDKTEHRSGIGNGGWKARLTEEEKVQIAEAEALIERIKSEAMKREIKKPEKGTKEWYEAEIARLTAKMNATK